MIVRHGAQGATDPGLLKDEAEGCDHHRRDHRSGDVDLLEDHAPAEHLPLVGAGRQAAAAR